jgi:nitroimidazol reductase NimA-like FMN-containing flavoprotein (pyridoxamine 5'-phosphate oxidase superfamily)
VTLTYGYDSYFKSLYFHCSKTGLKLDLHEKHPLAKTEHEKTIIQRQIDSTDRRIDELVYELYGLTKRY